MVELSLTRWVEPALEYFARESGIPVDDLAATQGGETIGTGLEVACDFFTKGWFNKAVQGLTGIIANSYAVWGKGVSSRLRKELLALGTHELLRILDPAPSEIFTIRSSMDESVAAIQRGDITGFLNSILRSPFEMQAMMTTGAAPQAARPAQVTPPTTRYIAQPQTTPPAGTAPVGRYQVTG